jgi:HAMP domain-containing protein
MKKRKVVLTIAGAALLALAGFMWFLSYQSYSRRSRAYSQIKLGMTRAEASAAIGLDPGYYEGQWPRPPSMGRTVRTPPLRQAGVAFDDLDNNRRKNLEVWVGRDYVIWVLFGADGVAIGSYLFELNPDPLAQTRFLSVFDEIREWLGM